MTDWDEQTADSWDKLGFYYEFHETLKQWRIYGCPKGIGKLVDNIKAFAGKSSGAQISDHIHLGPYNYFKLMIWNKPDITEDHIAGSPQNLLTLSRIIQNKLVAVHVGETFKVLEDYAPSSDIPLLFFVMSDKFVPSSVEFHSRY